LQRIKKHRPDILSPTSPVQLQLRWDHQFAGYYAADWQGFYAAEGLDVEIRSVLHTITAHGRCLSEHCRRKILNITDGVANPVRQQTPSGSGKILNIANGGCKPRPAASAHILNIADGVANPVRQRFLSYMVILLIFILIPINRQSAFQVGFPFVINHRPDWHTDDEQTLRAKKLTTAIWQGLSQDMSILTGL